MSNLKQLTEREKRVAALLSGDKSQCNLWLPDELVTALDTVTEKLERSRSQVAAHFLAAQVADAERELEHIVRVPIIGTLDQSNE